MARRPSTDIDDLTVPKDQERGGTATPANTAPAGGKMREYAHTLSLRLTAEQYRRLRRYVAAQEDQTGQRVTHQGIIETALAEWLDRNGG